MVALNAGRRAAALAARRGERAAPTSPGFGLPGHLATLLRASGWRRRSTRRGGAVLDGAREPCVDGARQGGTRRNLEVGVYPFPGVGAGVGEDDLLLLADAQTSGGLLVVARWPVVSSSARRSPARRVALS